MRNVILDANVALYENRPDLFDAAAAGIHDVLTVQGLNGKIVSGGPYSAEIISGIEHEVHNPERGQVDLVDFVPVLAKRTNLEASTPNFILTAQDLHYGEQTSFVFGLTLPSWQLSVQSVARFVSYVDDPGIQRRLVRHIARHEYGHMAGMNELNDYANPDRRSGLYEGHCANLCTLRQVMCVQEVEALSLELSDRETAGFCVGCVASLRQKANA
jgi:predicted Zn-dependent protease